MIQMLKLFSYHHNDAATQKKWRKLNKIEQKPQLSLIYIVHTCWLSVLMEKAEICNNVLRSNPNKDRIHIICKEKNTKNKTI